MKKALFYGTVLIGTYLLVANATGSSGVIKAASTGSSGLIKTLQGRG